MSETVQSSAILSFSKRLIVMPGKRHAPSAMRAVQDPARGDAIAVGHLVDDLDPQVGEHRAVHRDGLRDAFLAAELERVDVVEEVVGVQLAGAFEIPAGADLFERRRGAGRLIHGR